MHNGGPTKTNKPATTDFSPLTHCARRPSRSWRPGSGRKSIFTGSISGSISGWILGGVSITSSSFCASWVPTINCWGFVSRLVYYPIPVNPNTSKEGTCIHMSTNFLQSCGFLLSEKCHPCIIMYIYIYILYTVHVHFRCSALRSSNCVRKMSEETNLASSGILLACFNHFNPSFVISQVACWIIVYQRKRLGWT